MPSQTTARLQEWSNVHTQLLWCYRGPVHPKGRDVETRSRNLFGWLLLRGSCVTTSATGTTRAEAGEWMLPPFGPRHQKFSAGARIITVAFRAEWSGGQSLYDHGGGIVLPKREHPAMEQTATELVEFIEREFPAAGNELFLEAGTIAQHWELQLRFAGWLRAYALALESIGVKPIRPLAADPRLANAMQVIERHALNLPFRESTVAREAGMSVAHLHRLFVGQTGKTPRERFEERRQQAAVTLVEQSQRPLKVISADLGFSSPSHFSRWFSKRLKTAPRARRQNPAPAVSPW